jgi:hypothetical protein
MSVAASVTSLDVCEEAAAARRGAANARVSIR